MTTSNSYRNVSYSSVVRTDEERKVADGVSQRNDLAMKQQPTTRNEILQSVGRILDWVHGPGTKLLDSQRELPRNFDEADRIRKNHEQFEFKCMQSLANYASLRDIRTNDNEVAEYLEKLDITIQDFLRRLQNRRQVVVSLYTFFRLLKELEAYFGDITSLLRQESQVTIEDTENYLLAIEKMLRHCDSLYQQLYMEGERIRAIVSSQEILTIVANYLADVRPRLGKQLEALKIRILETKKYLQLLVYDRDARQTVTWLDEIIRVVVESYLKYNVGKTPMETQQMLQQHRTLLVKSQETYDYGLELIAALEKIYRAQGEFTNDCSAMRSSLEVNWRRLNEILQEVNDRYATADTFHVNVDLSLERIERLILLICRDLDTGISLEDVRKTYARERDEIVQAYENTKRIGVGLMERIQIPVANIQETIDQVMIDQVQDVIKVKLFTLWLKIRELYYYLGQVIEITEVTERWKVIRITIDKFYESLLYWEVRWKNGDLPFTIPEAESLIEEHRRAKDEIGGIWRSVRRDLESLAGDSEIAAMARKATEDVDRKMEDWQQRWERHMAVLEMRYRLLLRLRDLGVEIDRLCVWLREVKDRSVEQLWIVTGMADEVARMLDGVPDVRTKMQSLFAETREKVQRDFERHIGPIEDKWRIYVKDLELLQMFINTILRMLQFIEKLELFIEELVVQLPLCKSRDEAEPWFQKIQEYNRTTASFDCDWLVNSATQLFGSGEKPRPVIERLRLIAARLKIFEAQIEEITTITTVKMVKSVPRWILRELDNVTLPEKASCTLVVEYSSPAKVVEAEWQRNGRPLPIRRLGGKWRLEEREGYTSVTCDYLTLDDAGVVTCLLRDPDGVMETTCRLKVVSPPAFPRELTSVRVRQGEPILLQCQVTGSPRPDVLWFKDKQPVRPSFDYDIDYVDGVCALKVSAADGSHAGTYRCQASNEAGEASTVAVVEVQEFVKGWFTRPLTDQDLVEGGRLLLRVDFEGEPEPEVAWFRDSTRLVHSPPRLRVETRHGCSTCIIDPLLVEDDGLYSVQLTNPGGVQKSVCNVTIRSRGEPPSCWSQLMDVKVLEGSSLRLNCRFSGKPAPEVTWYFNGRPLSRRSGLRVHSDQFTGLHTLEIEEALLEDDGEYRAVAENKEGRTDTSCRITVENYTPVPCAPRFTGDICEELVAHVSDKVTLQCTVHGHPLPSVSWFKDERRLISDEHVIVSGNEEVHSLVIPYVRLQDEGVYKIKAGNSIGSAECSCTLRVEDEEMIAKRTTLVFHNTLIKEPPEFIRLFRDEVCKTGDDVVLECEIHGIPEPTVWWSFNAEPITDHDRRFKTASNGHVHTLFIKGARDSETGRYSITAENSSGVATCSALLVVEELGRTGSFERAAQLSSWGSNTHLASSSAYETRRAFGEVKVSGSDGYSRGPTAIVDASRVGHSVHSFGEVKLSGSDSYSKESTAIVDASRGRSAYTFGEVKVSGSGSDNYSKESTAVVDASGGRSVHTFGEVKVSGSDSYSRGPTAIVDASRVGHSVHSFGEVKLSGSDSYSKEPTDIVDVSRGRSVYTFGEVELSGSDSYSKEPTAVVTSGWGRSVHTTGDLKYQGSQSRTVESTSEDMMDASRVRSVNVTHSVPQPYEVAVKEVRHEVNYVEAPQERHAWAFKTTPERQVFTAEVKPEHQVWTTTKTFSSRDGSGTKQDMDAHLDSLLMQKESSTVSGSVTSTTTSRTVKSTNYYQNQFEELSMTKFGSV